MCRTVQQNGVGLVAFFLMNLLLSLASQSRFVLAAFPFVVAFTVKASEDLAWKPAHVWLLCTLSLLFSKVWLTINQAPWTEDSSLLEIPAQLLFMNIGPWMSPTMYAVQGSAVLLAGLMSIVLVRGVRKAEPEQNSAGG